MAGRTNLAVTSVNRTALTAMPAPSTAADVSNGNQCTNDGATMLALLNADGAATHTLTVTVASGADGLASPTRSYTLPISSSTQLAGPFPVTFYGTVLAFTADSTQVKIAPYSLLGP